MRVSIIMEALTGRFVTDTDKASKQFSRKMKNMQRDAAMMARRIGVAVAAAAASFVYFAIRTTKATDEMIKFGHRLGLTAEEMRRLQFVGDRTGTNITSLANAMQRLTRNLADARDGTGPAVDALEKLGLSARDLLDMSQEEAFFAIAKELKNVADRGTQTQAAFNLLGREGQSLLGMINRSGDQFAEMAAEFDKFNLSLSNLQAKNVENLADAMSDVSTVLGMVRQRFVAELSPAITSVLDKLVLARVRSGEFGETADAAARATVRGFARVLDGAANIVQAIEDYPTSAQFGIVGLLIFGKKGALIGAAIGATFDMVTDTARLFGVAVEGEAARLGRIQRDIESIERLIQRGRALPHQIALLEQLREQHEALAGALSTQAAEDYAKFFAPAEEQVGRLSSSIREAAEAMRAGIGGALEIDVLPRIVGDMDIDELPDAIEDSVQRTIAALERQAATLGMTTSEMTLYGLRVDEATEAQLRHAEALLATIDEHGRMQDLVQEAGRVFEDTRTDLERFNAQIERLNELRDTFIDGKPLIDADTYERAVAAAQDALTKTENMMTEFARQGARNMQTHFAEFLFNPLEEGFRGMVRGFSESLRRMMAEAASSMVFQALFGGLAGSANPFLSTLGTTFGGGRAAGGPVKAGVSYLVGERGPERFVPTTSGAILPGAASLTVNVYNQTGGAAEVETRQSGPNMIDVLVSAVSSAIADGRLDSTMRGRFGTHPVVGGRR
jgi:nitrogen fixation protein FixH